MKPTTSKLLAMDGTPAMLVDKNPLGSNGLRETSPAVFFNARVDTKDFIICAGFVLLWLICLAIIAEILRAGFVCLKNWIANRSAERRVDREFEK